MAKKKSDKKTYLQGEITLDLSNLIERLDRIEKQIFEINQRTALTNTNISPGKEKNTKKTSPNQTRLKKTDLVFNFYKKNKETTVSFQELKEKLPLEDKVLRNIVFRLKKLGKIRQVERGEYQFVGENQEG